MLAKFNSSRPDKRHKLKPVDSSLYKVEIASKEQAKEQAQNASGSEGTAEAGSHGVFDAKPAFLPGSDDEGDMEGDAADDEEGREGVESMDEQERLRKEELLLHAGKRGAGEARILHRLVVAELGRALGRERARLLARGAAQRGAEVVARALAVVRRAHRLRFQLDAVVADEPQAAGRASVAEAARHALLEAGRVLADVALTAWAHAPSPPARAARGACTPNPPPASTTAEMRDALAGRGAETTIAVVSTS